MSKREPVMLAHTYDEQKHDICGWYLSEKLDGIRVWWDGGVSRGMWANDVPWYNSERDGRYINRVRSTGLWTRLYKTIQAPDWWLDQLPVGVILDGELYSERGWQYTSSIVKKMVMNRDDTGWRGIGYYVFDEPGLIDILDPRMIDVRSTTGFRKDMSSCIDWVKGMGMDIGVDIGKSKTFEWAYKGLIKKISDGVIKDDGVVRILRQDQLPMVLDEAKKEMYGRLKIVLDKGGEGLIARAPWSRWTPERSKNLLKIKGINDDEGRVIGYIGGKGKLSGLFGALILDYKGKRLELSGFTNDERRMVEIDGGNEYTVPSYMGGEELGDNVEGKYFKRGDIITFLYRELSDNGIPKECRYWRKA